MTETDTETRRYLQESEHWLDCGGSRMRYVYLPAREPLTPPRAPLVLVHGLMGYSFSWRFNLVDLSLHRDVFAVDLLGIGHSDRPRPGAADYGLPAAAERLLALIRTIASPQVDLLGTSHGGAVAMMAAAIDASHSAPLSAPRIRRLVLVAPAHPFMINARLRIAFFRSPFGRFLGRRILRHSAALRMLSIGRLYADESKVTRETRRGYDVNLLDRSSYDYAMELVRTWNEDMQRLRNALPSIAHLPVLLLWGEQDQAVACHSALMLREFFRAPQHIVFPGLGHMTYEEDPALFNRTVLQFLDS